jgi:fibronectin-binding autotransporter adhesin
MVQLDPAHNYASQSFALSADAGSGTDVRALVPLFVSSADFVPTSGPLRAGQSITITLHLNEHPVTVAGAPKLRLSNGAFAAYVAAASSPSSGTLVFKYTVSAGQDTSDLQIAGVVTSGASVKDTTGSHNSADFSYVPNSDLGLAVDTRAPSITNVRVTVSSGGTAVGLGGTVAIELQLSEAVVVSGTPTLKLSDGGTAVYVSGGSSNPASGSLEFDYTVGSGQNTADLTISSLSLLSGATITDSAGNPVNPTLPAAGKNLHLTIDSIRPSVTSATVAPSSGTISNGGTAVITLKLSETVTVSGGTPVLDLNDGGSAIYAGGAGTTSLTFDYVVGSETTADLRIAGIENAATITDSAGNALASGLSSDLKLGVNADFWKTGKSGNFATGSNWTLNAPPSSGQEAVINVAGTYTVSVTSAAAVAAIGIGNKGATLSIASGATFSAANGTGIDANLGAVVAHSGATFAAGGFFANSGTVSAAGGSVVLSGGTVGNSSAGTIAASGGGVVELIGATILGGALKTAGSGSLIETASGSADLISGSTIGPGALVQVSDGSTLTLAGIVRNSGTIVVAGTDATLLLLDNVSVTGPGKLQASGTGALIETVSGTVDAISGATIASGTLVEITSASTLKLSGAPIGSGGIVVVESGGTVSNATVSNGGTLIVSSGGLADPTTVLSGGTEVVSCGGADDGALVSGGTQEVFGSASGVTVRTGAQVVLSGGVAVATAVKNGGVELVSGGGSATGIISSGGVLELIGAGQDVGAMTLSRGAILELLSGAFTGNAVSSGVTTKALAGGTQSGGAVLSGGVLDIFSGGLGSGMTVSRGGRLVIFSGGTGVGATVASGGTEIVSAGGIESGLAISAHGTAIVSSGGVVELVGTNTTSGLTLLSGATLEVGSGYTLGSFVVSKGVTVAVLSGGIVTSATSVGNGGILELLGGSTASATLISGATLEVASGYVLNGQVVSKGRTLDVAADGAASATVILAGGTEIIASGGIELGVKSIASGGLLETAAGGTAIVSGTVTNSGTLFASGADSLIDIVGGAIVTGGGIARIGNGIVDIESAGDNQNVVFQSGGSGGLEIGVLGNAYTGTVSGFGQNTHQFIDFTAIGSASATFSYTSTSAKSGVLTVVSGGTSASIHLSGHYTSANFNITAGVGGSVEIVDPPVAAPPAAVVSADLALFVNYVAASFPAVAHQGGFATDLSQPAGEQPLLTHPGR